MGEEFLGLVEQNAHSRTRNADVGMAFLDPVVCVVPGVEERLRIVEPRGAVQAPFTVAEHIAFGDRKSTRLNSSHVSISYAVFCLKNKTIYTVYLCLNTR